MHKKNAETEEGAIVTAVNTITREINSIDDKERSYSSPDSIPSPTDRIAARPFRLYEVNSTMPSTREANTTVDISFDDDSKSIPSAPSTFVSSALKSVPKTLSRNASNLSSPSGDAVSASLEGPQLAPKNPRPPPSPSPPEPDPDPEPEPASETVPETVQPAQPTAKKTKISRAIRDLMTYNTSGLSYWESAESEQLPNNPDLSLRKRKRTKSKAEQHRINGGGGKVQATSSTKQNKKEAKTKAKKPKDNSMEVKNDQPHILSKKATNRSVRRQTKSKTDSDEASSISAVVSETRGEATASAAVLDKFFEKGDLVLVEEHAWAYVDNSGGIGKVVKAYIDEDGDRVYDVKYPALNRTEKGLLAKYIISYSWDFEY